MTIKSYHWWSEYIYLNFIKVVFCMSFPPYDDEPPYAAVQRVDYDEPPMVPAPPLHIPTMR